MNAIRPPKGWRWLAVGEMQKPGDKCVWNGWNIIIGYHCTDTHCTIRKIKRKVKR